MRAQWLQSENGNRTQAVFANRLRRSQRTPSSIVPSGPAVSPLPIDGDAASFRRHPQPMWIYDLESLRILAVNEAAVEEYGYSCEEFLSLRMTDINAPDEIGRLLGDLAAGLPARGQSAVWAHRRRDGRLMPVEVTSQGCAFAGREAALVTARDMTVEQRIARGLWSSEDRFRLLVEHSSDLILVIGRDRKILYATPACASVLGYDPGSLAGKGAFSMVHPEDWARALPDLGEFMRTPGGSIQLELRVRHADRHWVTLEAHCQNLLAEPSVQGVVVNTRDVTQRKEAEEKVKRQVRQLRALRLIDASITSGRGLRETAGILLDQVTSCLSVDAACLSLVHGEGEALSLVAARGFRADCADQTLPAVLPGRIRPVLRERRLASLQRLDAALDPGSYWLTEGEGFTAWWGAPVLVKDRVGAVLEIFHRSPLDPDADWFEFFDTLAGQAAIAIESSRLITELERSNTDLQASYDRTLEGWVRAVDLRDHETRGHTDRVTELTERLAQRMGFAAEEITQLRRGALLHDIGKIAIPDQVLLKPATLNDEEWKVMRLHPLYAYEFLFPIPHLRAALDIPLYHHEWWDGNGYPYGLRGTEIPLAARLFALVDVWDALRSERPYRQPWTAEDALAHIRRGSGTHFDPDIVPIFLGMIDEMNESPCSRIEE
jgi:PAS domain S-box-containing protein